MNFTQKETEFDNILSALWKAIDARTVLALKAGDIPTFDFERGQLSAVELVQRLHSTL
jgi:hypothetical protein